MTRCPERNPPVNTMSREGNEVFWGIGPNHKTLGIFYGALPGIQDPARAFMNECTDEIPPLAHTGINAASSMFQRGANVSNSIAQEQGITLSGDVLSFAGLWVHIVTFGNSSLGLSIHDPVIRMERAVNFRINPALGHTEAPSIIPISQKIHSEELLIFRLPRTIL